MNIKASQPLAPIIVVSHADGSPPELPIADDQGPVGKDIGFDIESGEGGVDHTPVETTIDICARCGQTHEKLIFHPFIRRGITVERGEGDIQTMTHFALCPDLNEPLLMRIVQDEPDLDQAEIS